MLKQSNFRVRACEVKTNSLLFSVSFNGYHSVNIRLTTETVTSYLLQNQAEKLDADVWYSLSRSCFFFLFLPSISPALLPPFHATFGSSGEQSTSTVMKLLPHFPTPFCHTSTVKYASTPTIKSVCSQHGHAIGRTIMETEIYGRDQLCLRNCT